MPDPSAPPPGSPIEPAAGSTLPDPCANARIKLSVGVVFSPEQVDLAGGLDNVVSATKAAVFNTYGSERLCSGQFQQSTVVQVSEGPGGGGRAELACCRCLHGIRRFRSRFRSHLCGEFERSRRFPHSIT